MNKGTAVTIIGGGLAGCEAAYQAARLGARVAVHEMKPERFSPAHVMEGLAELVCSNSLKSEDLTTATGLLKKEMSLLGSLIIEAAGRTRVSAGNTLAVDRSAFSSYITERLTGMGVEVIRGEVIEVPGSRPLVVATGPLTSDALASSIERLIGRTPDEGRLYFYDAVSPIVYTDSIDMGHAFLASRYGKGGADYINCPLDEDEYALFVEELRKADRAIARQFEKEPFFEGCLPIEVMAGRGVETLRFGPMKPVGLIDPATGKRPYAVVQLRSENASNTLYNIVGFQTRLTYPEQKRVFSLIPALKNAEFARYGKMHRNTYMDSPRLLDPTCELKSIRGVFFAGQMTGVEGYVESAASGLVAGINAARSFKSLSPASPPRDTLIGSLLGYVSSAPAPFQPMNANFGILPEGNFSVREKKKRREAQIKRAIEAAALWANEILATSLSI